MTLFHCTKGTVKAAAKATHPIAEECPRLKAVLRANPEYGVVIPGTSGLRKMRVRVKGLKGQRSGYRAIYSKHETDDGVRIAFHYVYYKGDAADLHPDQYSSLRAEAEQLARGLNHVAWSD